MTKEAVLKTYIKCKYDYKVKRVKGYVDGYYLLEQTPFDSGWQIVTDGPCAYKIFPSLSSIIDTLETVCIGG